MVSFERIAKIEKHSTVANPLMTLINKRYANVDCLSKKSQAYRDYVETVNVCQGILQSVYTLLDEGKL